MENTTSENTASLHMETNNNFDSLLVKSGPIDSLHWLDIDYASKLMKLDLYDSVTMNKENFFEMIGKSLEVEKYNSSKLNIISNIIGDEPNYLYQLFYIDLKEYKEFHKDENINHMANLLNVNDDVIYSNAIIFKNYFPSLSESMTLETVTKKDIEKLLYHRVNTKVVTFDDNFTEQLVEGDLTIFATKFFDGDTYKKIEMGFLLHNINIWYTTDYGNHDVCGKLVNDKIEKCIIFTMKTDEYRGNITLEEVNKIIDLSRKLDTFITPEELSKEKIDNYGRKIINDKYKVLDYLYNKYNI